MVARRPGSEEALFATNRKALRDYEILERLEAGVQLKGPEIKAIRQRRVSLDGSFARIDGGEVFLYNMHVSPYEHGGPYNVEPLRVRKLLLHRQEIERLVGLLSRKRATLVPLRLYQARGNAKVELAVGRGRRTYEKRDRIREREAAREIGRRLRRHQRD